jgi:hypothetical protein
MGVFSGPEIATSGLIFSFDQSNTDKSWKGKPTTNFYTNGHFSRGNGVTQESGSNATNEVILFRNPGDSEYVLRQTGTVAFTEYQINLTTQLAASTTYVLSGWYAESPDYSCADGSRMFHSRAYSTSGANVALGIGIGTVLETRIVNGITWKYCYATITTPADYNNVFEWYLGYGGSAYTGYRYYTNLQMEVGTFPSRFVDGTRSSSQALLDLTGRNTTTATSLTYASNGSFSFSGSDSITLPNNSNYDFSSGQTIEIWLRPTENDATRRNPYNQAYGGYGTWTHEPSGAFNYYYGDAGVNGEPYIGHTSSFTVTQNEIACVCTTRNTSESWWYKNGVADTQYTHSFANLTATSADILIGTGYAGGYIGDIYAVKIYNRALTAAEVRQNFNSQRSRFGL